MISSSHDVVLKGDGVPVEKLGEGGPEATCETCVPICRPSSRDYDGKVT